MNRLDRDRSKLVGDASDPEPASRPAFTAIDALASDAGVDPPAVDADFDEHFDEEKRDFAVTNVVVGKFPDATDADGSGVIYVHPRTLVRSSNRGRHGSISGSTTPQRDGRHKLRRIARRVTTEETSLSALSVRARGGVPLCRSSEKPPNLTETSEHRPELHEDAPFRSRPVKREVMIRIDADERRYLDGEFVVEPANREVTTSG